jgi:hypothetical protein
LRAFKWTGWVRELSKYYMASDSVVGDSIPASESGFDPRKTIPALPVVWNGFLTLLVAGPWLGGGYIFGTDWPGPRRFDFPTDLSASWAPVEAALAAVSRVVSSEWTGKLFVLGLLFVAALMAFRAAPTNGFVPRAVASTVYIFNPFVFGRLHYGQMFVLAGYALLPWVAIRFRELLLKPSVKAGLLLALSLTVVGITSSHMFLVAGAIVAALLLTHLVAEGKRLEYVRRVSPSLLVAAVATLVASSYWLAPFVLGRGPIAKVVAGFTKADLSVYAAVPDKQLGLLPNLLGLYGFWAENTARFTSMKAFVPFWPAVLVVILAIGMVGAVAALRSRRDRLAPWIAGLLVSALIALVLEMGASHPWTSGLVTWLDANFPVYRGMRDAGKWAALLAFVYSQLFALGTATTVDRIRSRRHDPARADWTIGIATGLLLAFPLYYGNGLLFGMHGEIKPSQYPAGWYAADRVLAADQHHGRTLFLPWHEYMTLSFVRNENSLVASPAPSFFSTPVLASTNPDVPGTAAPTDPDQVAIASLVDAGAQGHWAEVLAARNIKYVLLAREANWQSYQYLAGQRGLSLVGDYGSIVLYRNNLVP